MPYIEALASPCSYLKKSARPVGELPLEKLVAANTGRKFAVEKITKKHAGHYWIKFSGVLTIAGEKWEGAWIYPNKQHWGGLESLEETFEPVTGASGGGNGNGSTKKLTDAQIAQLAKSFDLDPAAVKAVIEIESAGDGFLADGSPKILFEAHWFGYYTNDKYNATHPDIACYSWDEARQHYVGGAGEWNRLQRAMHLDKEAALKSASWGLGQVMGFNHGLCGYSDVFSFVEAMGKNEYEQAMAMFKFIESNNLDDELQRLDWAGFAHGYNGEGYKVNRYDQKLAAAYEKHQGKTSVQVQEGDGKVLHSVPFWHQLDNRVNPHTTCNISCHAMYVKFLRPEMINSDDEYLDAFYAKYNDSTVHAYHTELLREKYGIDSVWRTNMTFDDLYEEAKQRPLPIGTLHTGSLSWPTGSHIVLLRGYSADRKTFYLNNPYGAEPYTTDVKTGKCEFRSWKNLNARWYDPPSDSKGGHGRIFKGFV